MASYIYKSPEKWVDGKGNSHIPRYDLAIVIGRFQPLHRAHERLFHIGLEKADHLLVIIGSANKARDIKNPFTNGERREMVLRTLGHLNADYRVECVTDDLYSDQRWLAEIQSHVDRYTLDLGIPRKEVKITVVGHHKDASSYYLDKFPKWDRIEVDSVEHPDGTEIRTAMFKHNRIPDIAVPMGVETYIRNWAVCQPETLANLSAEFKFYEEYAKPYEKLPFPPIFHTTDNVVICNGHVLLVKRRNHPGKGLWAVPGGFLNASESIKDGAYRELIEETKIRVPESLLKASVKSQHTFDAPGRSLRGRTITTAFLYVLDQPVLPKIKGDDDAEQARWVPLAEFYAMPDQMFEDHYSIVSYFIGRI